MPAGLSQFGIDQFNVYVSTTEFIPGNGDQIANWGNRIFEIGS